MDRLTVGGSGVSKGRFRPAACAKRAVYCIFTLHELQTYAPSCCVQLRGAPHTAHALLSVGGFIPRLHVAFHDIPRSMLRPMLLL